MSTTPVDSSRNNLLTEISAGIDSATGEFIVVDDVSLHFTVRGAGRAIVLLHGNSGSQLDFPQALIDQLSTDFRLVLIDRPGHGLSERPEDRVLTVEHQAELVHALLGKLGINNPLLVGHSWGGSLCLAYALKYPDFYAGAVLLAPYAFESADAQSRLDFFLAATLPTLPVVGDVAIRLLTPLIGEWMIEQGLKEAFHPDAVPEAYLEAAKKAWTRPTQVRAYAEDEKTIDESLAKLSSRFAEIRKPLVVIAGELDALVPPGDHAVRLSETVPGARLVVISSAGHQIHHTHPTEVIEAIRMAFEMEARLEAINESI